MISPLVFISWHLPNDFVCLTVYPLQYVLLCLLIWLLGIHDVLCISLPLPCIKLEAALVVQALLSHYFAHLLVFEECYLPIIEVEALWEIFVVSLLEARYVSEKRNHSCFSMLLLITVLYKDTHLDRTAGRGVRLKLSWSMLDARILQDIDEENHYRLEGLRKEFVIRKHLIFLWTIGTAREREWRVLMCWRGSICCMDLMEEECHCESYHFGKAFLVSLV